MSKELQQVQTEETGGVTLSLTPEAADSYHWPKQRAGRWSQFHSHRKRSQVHYCCLQDKICRQQIFYHRHWWWDAY